MMFWDTVPLPSRTVMPNGSAAYDPFKYYIIRTFSLKVNLEYVTIGKRILPIDEGKKE